MTGDDEWALRVSNVGVHAASVSVTLPRAIGAAPLAIGGSRALELREQVERSEPGPTKEYRGVPYRIGQDKPLPGIRWFLQRAKDHFGTLVWESSPGAWYGPEAPGLAEAAVKKIIDMRAEAEAEPARVDALLCARVGR